MKPEVIIELYNRSRNKKEKDLLSHSLMSMIIDNPITDQWNFIAPELEEEMWKDIHGFEGQYQISSFGRVKKINHYKDDPISNDRISHYRSYSGKHYPHVKIGSRRKFIQLRIHIEVAKAFVPNPNNLPIVNHKDGDKNNTYYKNLEWSNTLLNNIHARVSGLNNAIGSGNSMSKITEEDALFIFNSEMRQIDLAEKFGIAQYTVSCIKRGMTWTHVTGKVFYRRKLTREQAIEIFQSDLPAKELAIQYGVTASNISTIKSGKTFNLLKEFGKPESVDLKGSNYYLGREKIVEIFKSEGGVNDIARRFEVSPCTVSLIKNGKRWAEVTKNI